MWVLCSGNADGHKDNLAPENYDAFVDYLTEVVGYYRHEMNFTFRTVEPFNEPFSWNWHAGNDQEGCHYDPSTQDIVLQVGIHDGHTLYQRNLSRWIGGHGDDDVCPSGYFFSIEC